MPDNFVPDSFHTAVTAEIWRRLKHHSTLSRTRLKMQQAIRNLK